MTIRMIRWEGRCYNDDGVEMTMGMKCNSQRDMCNMGDEGDEIG